MARTKNKDAVDLSVKLAADIVRMARVVAELKGTKVAPYLSAILRPIVERDYKSELAKEAKRLGS